MTTKRDAARVLSEIAFFLRLNGDNPYKALAYERAARALLLCPHEPDQLLQGDRLTDVPGIGPATAAVIRELFLTGNSNLYQRAKGSYPPSLIELGRIPGLRAKQLRRLYEQGGIRSISDLQNACRDNRLVAVKGIGPKLQAKLLSALGEYRRGQGYRLFASVIEEASMVEHHLAGIPAVQRVSVAGALRRKLEVINALQFVVTWPDRDTAAFIKALLTIPNMTDIGIIDERRVTAVSPTGLPITLALAQPTDHDFHLLLETGSHGHLQQLLKRFSVKALPTWKDIHIRTKGLNEEAIYRAAGLPFIPPAMREGQGEFDFPDTDLQRLVEPGQIQGCFHVHTNYSDGSGTVEDMVVAARARGYRYLGISDHSQSAFYANGLNEARIRQQWKEIEAVQANYPDIHIFRGIEADILPDGAMDYGDELLSQFDFVIASVHSRFNLPETDQTRRVCRAVANPYVTMLGHPTGRLLLSRPGYRVNLGQVIDAAKAHDTVLEINGSRHRLDLDWREVRLAKTRGLMFSLNPDAHALNEFSNVGLAVNVAQKGGLLAEDIVNTRSLPAMKAFLQKPASRAS